MPKGKLGAGMSVEEGYRHARGVGLVLIAALRQALGDLDRVEDIVKVLGMVNAAPPISRTTRKSSTAARICLSRSLASVAAMPARRSG